MNKRKLDQLFKLARQAPPPGPPDDFEADVMRAIHADQPRRGPEARTLFEQLSFLFPRIAWAAVLVIVVCVAVDFGSGAAAGPGLAESMAQVSEDWLFIPGGF